MCGMKLISVVANRTILFGGSTKFNINACSRAGLLLKTNNEKSEYNVYSGSRPFSLQSSIESLIRTQTGIFKSISESAPVDLFQTCMVTIHDTAGLPWWATIICTTIALRTIITLPLAMYQNYILAKFENLHLEMPDIVKELRKETAVAIKMFNWDDKTAKLHYNRAVSIYSLHNTNTYLRLLHCGLLLSTTGDTVIISFPVKKAMEWLNCT